MPSPNTKLQERIKKLQNQLKQAQLKYNDFANNLGKMSPHEHISLLEGQRMKLLVLEEMIHQLKTTHGKDSESTEVHALIDGQPKAFCISTHPDTADPNSISSESPIGSALLTMEINQEKLLKIPAGEIKLKRLS